MAFARSLSPKVLIALSAFISLGCTTNIKIEEIDPDTSLERASESALNSAELSERTRQMLYVLDLLEPYDDDPEKATRQLNKVLQKTGLRGLSFSLSEICYLRASESEEYSPEWVKLNASALCYAYSFLFDTKLVPRANPFDYRFRHACDIYNRAAARLMLNVERAGWKGAAVKGFEIPTIIGALFVTRAEDRLAWDPLNFDRFLVAYGYNVQGLTVENKSFGLGVPCIALGKAPEDVAGGKDDELRVRIQQSYATTLFLRLEGSILDQIAGKKRQAKVEVYDPMETRRIRVGREIVPLETDLTTPLAHMFAFVEPPAFVTSLLDVNRIGERKGLYMLQPFQKDKIPVVFTHGLLSTPLTWLPMINGLFVDPKIRERFQFWFFFYPTGDPIPLNAAVLRRSLLKLIRLYDPKGNNPAFNNTVLVGHSMGGIISRMMVQSSGDKLWELISKKPLEEVEVSEELKKTFQETFFFEPVPQVKRLCFLAVPHRGSDKAVGLFDTISRWFTTMPKSVVAKVNAARRALRQNIAEGLGLDTTPTGVRGLRSDNPFTKACADLPISPEVEFHSIIGNTDGTKKGGSDSIVSYISSHLEGAVSEMIVRSGHSVQLQPAAIREVRRVLLLHLESFDKAQAKKEK